MARRLKPEEARAGCDAASLPFRSTAELEPLETMIGQERAVEATAFGIAMRRAGYNLFVLGPPRTGKTSAMRWALERAARDEPTPPDHCYVHNFADAYRPAALQLPAGRGHELRTEVARVVEECRTRLPRAFEDEEFERRKTQIAERAAERERAEVAEVEKRAEASGFALLRTQAGIGLVPAPEGKPLSKADFDALPEETKKEYAQRTEALEEHLEAARRELRKVEREAREASDELVRSVAASVTRQILFDLRERFRGLDAVQAWLDAFEADLVSHVEDFQRLSDGSPQLPFAPPPGAFLDRYRVNVLVDRAGAKGAPVVYEEHPTWANLMGRVEHRVQMGNLVTDFTLVRAGALHRANGGYLLIEARDVLRNPFVWEALKKALQTRAIRIEDPLEEFRFVSAVGLAPAPIPLDVKVVLVGSPFLYYLLYALDEDFGELFKVKVDFDDSLPRTAEKELLFARFVGGCCREESLRPFTAGAVARLIEHGSRLVSDQGRLTARMGQVLDVLRDASFWAERRGHDEVRREDVSEAIDRRTHRSNLIEERLRRMFDEGTLLLATDGEAVGQVNGISVMSLGDHAFGRPVRITARTFAGEPGVLDIEREARLGGRVHSKGVMILTGFLAGRYGRQGPLALSASLGFEQQYEEIDGDSASSAELYALLSSLAGVPLSQSFAVTGSVNQRGEIQPVGGINEKIEGFFDVCRLRGLTGRQGVIVPETNVRHLMLREDVVEAVREGRFAVHAVSTVDEGLELLTGLPAGEADEEGRFPKGSFNAAVDAALAANLDRMRRHEAAARAAGTHRRRGEAPAKAPPPPPSPPKPPPAA